MAYQAGMHDRILSSRKYLPSVAKRAPKRENRSEYNRIITTKCAQITKGRGYGVLYTCENALKQNNEQQKEETQNKWGEE